MKHILITSIFLIFMSKAHAQQIIPLYQGDIPGGLTPPTSYVEKKEHDFIYKVSTPTLTVYKPQQANGTAIIICPGGGYGLLAMGHEGNAVAKRLAGLGITAFVLKYRLPNDAVMVDKSTGPLQDALQALYLLRKNASLWKIDAGKIGIMGFSAGGHLAASVSTHYNDLKISNEENISLRPDFSVLIYPVISFGPYTHAGSKNSLLGNAPTEAQIRYFSNELQVNSQTPPTFLVHANDDPTVNVLNSLMYNEALAKNKVKAEMHIYQGGGHGFGMNNKTTKDEWFDRLVEWLKTNKWL
jgi:acetyl esterase/lipase